MELIAVDQLTLFLGIFIKYSIEIDLDVKPNNFCITFGKLLKCDENGGRTF